MAKKNTPEDFKKRWQKVIGEFKDAGKELAGSLDDAMGGIPGKIGGLMQTSIGRPLASAIVLLKEFSDQVDGIGKKFGAIGVRDFTAELQKSAEITGRLGIGLDEAGDMARTLSEEFGYSFQEAIGITDEVADLSKVLGMSGDEAARLFGTLTKVGGLTSQQAIDLSKSAELLAKAEGVAPAAVMDQIAKDTEFFAKFSKDGGANIASAAVQALKLGTSLDKVAGIMEGMLDFQTSIEKEMEASILLGRQLNYQKARELALNNDIEGAMSEIIKQVGSEAEWNQLNAIQRKALADSIGVGVDQMAKFVSNQDKAATLGDRISKQEGFESLVGEDAISELSEVIYNLKTLGATLVRVIGPAINMILKPLVAVTKWFTEWSDGAKVAAATLGFVLLPQMLRFGKAQLMMIKKGAIWTAMLIKQNALWLVQKTLLVANRVITMGIAAAQMAYGVATGIATAATWAFSTAINSALAGIPALIGLIVAGIVYLTYNFEAVTSAITNAFSFLKSFIGGVFSGTMGVGKAIGKKLGGAWDGIKSGMQELFSWMKPQWESFGGFMSGIWDGIVGVFKGAINIYIRAVNSIIGLLNKIQIDIPSWVPKVGGKSFGFDLDKIPELADGGKVTGPTIAQLGEAGPEAIVPLDQANLFDTTPIVTAVNQLQVEMSMMRRDMEGYFGFGGSAVKGIGRSTVSAIEQAG